MRPSRLLAVLVVLVASALLPTPATAAALGSDDPEVRWIVRDCSKDGRLDHRYSLKALETALSLLSDDVREYTDCEDAILEAIEQAKRKLVRQVEKIFRDCEDGRLRRHRHYSILALKAALVLLPDDLREYTDCERAIAKALERTKRKLRREVRKIIRDCEDGRLSHRRRYSLEGLWAAVRTLPDDVREYTDCEKAILKAIRRHPDFKKKRDHHGSWWPMAGWARAG